MPFGPTIAVRIIGGRRNMRRYLRKWTATLAGIGGATILVWPTASRAQYLETYFPASVPGYDQELGVTVLSRQRPLYDEPGMRAGSFLVKPRLDEGFGYDSNPIGVQSTPGSWLLRTSPSVSANSDWSRNSLGINLSADNYQYWNTPNDSHTDWTTSIGGGYTIDRNDLTLAYSHLSLHQSPGDIGAVPSDTFVHYQVDNVRSAYTFDLGRFSFTPNIDARSYYFDNTTIEGVPTSQQYRNRYVLSGGITTRYALSDRHNLLFVLQGVDSHYTSTPVGQPTSNSTGILALGGLDYEVTGVWRYQVLVGVEVRKFQSAEFKTQTAPLAEASAIWTPTGLTTVTARLARVIEDASSEGTAGYTYTTARLVVDHEYLRNVLLEGRAGLQVAQYLQGGSTQTSFTFGGGVNWLLNRNMRLSADYDFTTRSSGSSAPVTGQPNLTTLTSSGYNRNLFLITMHFGL